MYMLVVKAKLDVPCNDRGNENRTASNTTVHVKHRSCNPKPEPLSLQPPGPKRCKIRNANCPTSALSSSARLPLRAKLVAV